MPKYPQKMTMAQNKNATTSSEHFERMLTKRPMNGMCPKSFKRQPQASMSRDQGQHLA